MDDESYNRLKIRTVVMPESIKWPEAKVHHWAKLHECASEAFDRVSRAYKALDEINADANLSPTGKADKYRKLAQKAVSDFRASNTLENARVSVAHMQKRWSEKLDAAIVPAADHGMAATYVQVRDRISGMDERARLSFVDKNIDNATIVSAVLTAPAFVSGLSDVEIGVIRQKLAKRVLAPEFAEQRDLTEKAMAVAERGWSRAQRLIE